MTTNNGLATIEAAGVEIDHAAILKFLNLDVRQPATQALLLVCDRYQLDPILKHMLLIQGTPYVTRDGYLAIAHRSGVFDGMDVVEQGSDQTHYTAKVSVYRKDMGHAFTFVGRYPKAKQMAKEYGPEMAVKVAEVQALRRAFNVTGVGAADERWDDAAVVDVTPPQPALPPAGVDATTGEVAAPRKRKPPTQPHPADGGPLSGSKPAVKQATPEQVADITELIDALKFQGDEWMAKGREAWKAAGVPSVGAAHLSEDDAAKAHVVLTKVLDEAVVAAMPDAPTLS